MYHILQFSRKHTFFFEIGIYLSLHLVASEATSNQLGEDKRRELEYDVTWTDT